MKYLCFGVGAIGTYIGGSLVIAGEEVVFLERPEFVDDLRNNGLSLELQNKAHILKSVQVVGSMDEALMLGPFDAAIFAIKSFDTQRTCKDLQPYRVALPPFICLQNGVENEAALADVFGSEKVIPGTVTSAIGRKAAGKIVLERLRGVGISSLHPLSTQIVDSFNRARLNARLYHQPEAMKWSKMLTNLLANASSAILNMTPAEIFSNPDLYALELKMLREALAIMRTEHIPVVGLPGTPVDWLVRVVEYLPAGWSQPMLKKVLGSGRGGKMPSFHIDLYAGRKKSEVEFLNGAVVRAGTRLGISTPVNKVLTDTLVGLADGLLDKEEFSRHPEKLLTLIRDEEKISL